MPDLPKPQDAAEAALFSECWDAVLSYADLCTSGSAAATQLATDAFTHGMHEAQALEFDTGAERGAGRRALRLPRIPFLLTWVRTTAAAWEAGGQGHRLDPDLRLWLNSDKAARYTGPPLYRPLALRALRDMQEPDAALLWLAEVESLPLGSVARRLGLDPAVAASELDQVRALFRDRCHRSQLDTPMNPDCRVYARLLDAVTRSPGTDTPDDLSRHLATCVGCAEAAACLGLHGGGLPAALAGGVIGWSGLAYLERRRRAADAGMLPGRADATGTDRGLSPGRETRSRFTLSRNGLLVAAGVVSVLTLAVSLTPFGGDDTTAGGSSDGSPVVQQDPRFPVTGAPSGDGSELQSTARPDATGSGAKDDAGDSDGKDKDKSKDGNGNEEPQGDASTPAVSPTSRSTPASRPPPPATSATKSSTNGPAASRPPSPSPPRRRSTAGASAGPTRATSASPRCGTAPSTRRAPRSASPPPTTTRPSRRAAPSASASWASGRASTTPLP